MDTYHLPQKSGIYQIINNINEKRYIGYASNIGMRLRGHKHNLIKGNHPNNYLQKAWLKYGPNSFSCSVITLCEKDKLCYLEDYFVKVLMTENDYYGYNLKPTDPNGLAGQSSATALKISIALKGRPVSANTRAARNAIPMTKAHKVKMALSRNIPSFKEAHRDKKGKPVINILTGEIFRSMIEVCEKHNFLKSTFSKKLCGTRTNNTTFKYL